MRCMEWLRMGLSLVILGLFFALDGIWAGEEGSPVIITEVCFLPQQGQPEWVEIKNVSGSPVDVSGWQITNGRGVNIILPKLPEMPPEAHVLIVIDGRGDSSFSSDINDLSFEGDNLVVLHTPRGVEGNVLGDVERGECALYSSGKRDANSIRAFVAWGHVPSDSQSVFDAVKAGVWLRKSCFVIVGPCSGIIGPELPIQAGGSIGLYEGCRGTQADEWLVYDPEEVSPGEENLLPAPQLHLPPDKDHIGSIEGPPRLTFSWIKLCGAHAYHFQLCKDPHCRELVIDAPDLKAPYYTVDLPFANAVFYWRVRAIAPSGERSEWSRPYKFIYGYPKGENK